MFLWILSLVKSMSKSSMLRFSSYFFSLHNHFLTLLCHFFVPPFLCPENLSHIFLPLWLSNYNLYFLLTFSPYYVLPDYLKKKFTLFFLFSYNIFFFSFLNTTHVTLLTDVSCDALWIAVKYGRFFWRFDRWVLLEYLWDEFFSWGREKW